MTENLTLHHTSSVEGMSVPNVRNTLSTIRQMWSLHSPVNPMYTCAMLPCGLCISEFAYVFVMGHHKKRHARPQSSRKMDDA